MKDRKEQDWIALNRIFRLPPRTEGGLAGEKKKEERMEEEEKGHTATQILLTCPRADPQQGILIRRGLCWWGPGQLVLASVLVLWLRGSQDLRAQHKHYGVSIVKLCRLPVSFAVVSLQAKIECCSFMAATKFICSLKSETNILPKEGE